MECPECDGPGVETGVLGNLMHFRCRNCGTEYAVGVKEYENPREKGDDDGLEYGDPRDHRDGLE